MSQSFGPEFRLHYHWEYRRFFEGSQVLRLRDCSVFRIANAHGHFRVGITIKARCGSVDRNRVKRQIRESFRLHRDVLGAYDYNVVVSGTKKLDYSYARRLGKTLKEEFPHAINRFKDAR